jgi:hypothetical protein
VTCVPCDMNMTCPAGQMAVCGYRFNECRGGEGVKLIGRDGEAEQCYDQNAWPWRSSYVADRDALYTQQYGSDWELYKQYHPEASFSYGSGTDYAGWCDSNGNYVGSPNSKGTSATTPKGRRDGTASLVDEYGTHGSCDDCFPCYPQVEPDTPHCICNWGYRDVDNSTADGNTVQCVAGTTDQYIPYTKIFQNGQLASFTIQPCEGGGCNLAGIKISLIALRELRADGTIIYDVEYPNMNDQLERHDDDGGIHLEYPTTTKYRGKSSAVPHRFDPHGPLDWDHTARPKNYCQCRHTMEDDDLDDIDFRVNDVTYESLQFDGSENRVQYIDWQVSPNGYRGFDARIASLIIDQDELDYSFGFFGQAPANGTTYFFSPATSFAFSTVIFDEEAAFCLDPNELLGCNDYISAASNAVQTCNTGSLGSPCGGSYAWYIDFNYSVIFAATGGYNGTDKVLNNGQGLVFWGPASAFLPSTTGALQDTCDARLDQRNMNNWAEPGTVQYVTSCLYPNGNITLNQQTLCNSVDNKTLVAAICMYVPGTQGWCGCVRETHVMKRGSFKFAIEAHNYTYSVNGDSFEVEFTIEPDMSPPKGVFYPGYVLPSWGGLVNGVDPDQSFNVVDQYGNPVVIGAVNMTDIILLPANMSARYNHWNPDNSTTLDGTPTYNYTDYPEGDFRLGASGTLRLSRFYSDDNTLHWQTFPAGYTFAGYADPNCTGHVVLTVRIRFPRPQVTSRRDDDETPITYIWDPVLHFGADASIPSNRPVYDPKAPAYNGLAYLGNQYANDRSVSKTSSAFPMGAIAGIVVAVVVVALIAVVAVSKLRGKAPTTKAAPVAPAPSLQTTTHDLIHI